MPGRGPTERGYWITALKSVGECSLLHRVLIRKALCLLKLKAACIFDLGRGTSIRGRSSIMVF